MIDLTKAEALDPYLAERLGRFNLNLPPLRERREDVAPLARTLTDRAAARLRGNRARLTSGALTLLAAQTWPGNVRELSIAIEKLVAFCSGTQITRSQVRSLLDENPKGVVSSRRLQTQQQREELIELIKKTGGNLAEVARQLDMSRGGVIYRAQKFGLLPKRI
jgi:DNA-binding NtrC family response regulator